MSDDAGEPAKKGASDDAKSDDGEVAASEAESEASAAPEAENEAPAPKKRKKKKRKPVSEDGVEPQVEAELRDDVPAFALSFPRDPALDALVAAFEQGDYARVRREGPLLAKKTDSDEVRAAARELARRIEPDPLAVYLLLGAAALLVFLAGWYWSHPHVP